ncbi:MAG: hypothetical protein MH213_03200 [Marinobacter sp.]|nr:hypothetical protein [Marinobacter sp.]
MDAIGSAARALRTGEAELMLAGGVESMSRAPFVMGKADSAFSRAAEIFRYHHRLALCESSVEKTVRR